MRLIEGSLVVIGKIGRLKHCYRLLHDRRPRVHACAIREDVEKVYVFISTQFAHAQCLDTLSRETTAVVLLALERRPKMDIYMARLDMGRAIT